MALMAAAVVTGCGGGGDPILGQGAGGVSNLPGINPAMLGAAAPFGIASTAGLTTSGPGVNTIHGDVVLITTLTCNTDPVPGGSNTGGLGTCGGTTPTLTGTVFIPTNPDTTTATAAEAGLTAAYNKITAAGLPGATVLGCGTIGTGGDAGAGIGCNGNATLPPGAYISNTSSSIGVTGDLTLDAQGNPNAVFVFQMPSSTLITATAGSAATRTRILLVNGAKASNVWWQVGSSATLGSYTEFQGNILASASITMLTGTTSCGRLLAGEASGAFVFAGNVISVPGQSFSPPVAVPAYSTTCQ